MESISDVVDEVIQNCPIDVRRPLYKVWPLCSRINWIHLEDNYNVMMHLCMVHVAVISPTVRNVNFWIEIKFKIKQGSVFLSEEYLIF